MKDFIGDDSGGEDAASSGDSEEKYELEQLEIALYSQIHFEENSELGENTCTYDVIDNLCIDVKGNWETGYVAKETNAKSILNEDIDKKYGILDNLKTVQSGILNHEEIDDNGKQTSKHSKRRKQSSSKTETLLKYMTESVLKDGNQTKSSPISSSSKKQKQLLSQPYQALSAETFIFGSNSRIKTADNDSDSKEKDNEVITIESDSEEDTRDHVLVDSESNSENDDERIAISFYVASDEEAELPSGTSSDSEGSLEVVLREKKSDSDENEADDIQMNVLSTPTPRYTYKKMTGEDVQDRDSYANEGEHWAIDRDDSVKDLRSTAQQGRYYKPIRCHNCNQVGHMSKVCPKPKKAAVCILCSEPGHLSRNCPNSVCYNCQTPGHNSKECSAPRRSLYLICYRCNMPGHDQTQCPDIWRQYHVTVTPGKIQKFTPTKKRKRLSCYNCGEEGHYGHECEEERMSKFLRVNTPFICRYQSEREIQNLVRKDEESTERPAKIPRISSDSGWFNMGNRDSNKGSIGSFIQSRTNLSRDENYGDFYRDKIYSSKSETLRTSKSETDLSSKKVSPFVHMVNRNQFENTGRSNFDKMQFTVINKKKAPKQSSEASPADCIQRTKSKRRKRQKQKKKKNKNETEFLTPNPPQQKPGNIRTSSHTDDSDTKGTIKTSDISDKKTHFNKRTVNHSQSDMSLVVTAHRTPKKDGENKGLKRSHTDMSLDHKTQQRDLREKIGKRPGSSTPCRQSAEELFSLWSEDTDDFPRNRKQSRHFEQDRTPPVGGIVENDRYRMDDLFSIQKIDQMQSGDLDPTMEEEIDHQVDSNEWWKRKRRRRRKGKKGKNTPV